MLDNIGHKLFFDELLKKSLFIFNSKILKSSVYLHILGI